ncbi:MAG TPA: CHASE3 domain-containing protein, partial [Thermoanaerobaculia bacterium]|nr:CHASE3 domain-containing protein [Thermoanaerobaculia bacterium]
MARHERRLSITLTIAIVVLAFNGLWAGGALGTLIDDSDWYAHTHQVIAQIEGVRATIAEATAAARAYLLTGDAAYLASYRAAAARFHRATARLQQLTVDNPSQERRIALLNQAIGVRLALCDEAIEARQRQGLDAARGLFMSHRNDAVVAQIGSLLAALEQEELRLLDTRTSRSNAAERTAKLAFLLVNLLAAGFLATVWLQARAAVAERSRHELELVDQREWLDTTLRSIGDGVLATDSAGNIQFMNAVTARLTGWTVEEASGRPLEEVFRIVDEQTRAPAENPVARALREGVVVGLANHTLLLSRAGAETPIDDSAAPIRSAGGATLGVVVVFRDVTERQQVERERERLLARERQSRYAAESANRAKDGFLATVSHELRTPLGVILGWAGILRAANADARTIGHAADVVERNARALAKLLDDMLDISRIVSGKVQIQPVEMDPGLVVTAAVEALRPAAEEKGVALELLLGPVPGPIVADPERLQQVVWNLLSNAVKFSGEGDKVTVWLGVAGDLLRIEVRDQGIGIAPERLPQVFDRFWQADTSSTRRHGGLGLGLAIARHLVEVHGGRVTASSGGEGHGSTFTVEIPVHGPKDVPAAAAAAGRTAAAAAATKPGGPAVVGRQVLQGARILVVDDERDAAEWVAELLQAEGAEVRTEESAAAGLAALRGWRPDLLIADIGMPGEDGYGLMKRVRALSPEEGRQTAALALTAHARPEDRMRVLSVGYQM